jgi:hypothetical protein
MLGITLGLFLSVFALDAFSPGKPLGRASVDFVIHLAPSALVLAIVALSWRRAWIGGFAFLALAVAYALGVGFRLDWVMWIAGPLFLVGVVFLWSWRHHHGLLVGR